MGSTPPQKIYTASKNLWVYFLARFFDLGEDLVIINQQGN